MAFVVDANVCQVLALVLLFLSSGFKIQQSFSIFVKLLSCTDILTQLIPV